MATELSPRGLSNVLGAGIFKYRGSETRGRQSVRYDFRVPVLLQPLQIMMAGVVGTVGEEGSIWVDPQSLDLIRIESDATEIPSYLPLQWSDLNIDYARLRIGGGDALLAQQADSSMLNTDGLDSYNRIDFTHCHSFITNSAVKFDSKLDELGGSGSARPAPSGRNAPCFMRRSES